MLGHSGAKIHYHSTCVEKTGNVSELHLQADLLKHLGSEVGPEFLEKTECGYTMQRLEPMPIPKSELELSLRLAQVMYLLAKKVWARPARGVSSNWRVALAAWAGAKGQAVNHLPEQTLGQGRAGQAGGGMGAGQTLPPATDRPSAPGKGQPGVAILDGLQLDRLYPQRKELDPVCLIHGDPTLANTMLATNHEVRLIDPLPNRPWVPELIEVDVGKLLQSALGWEHLLEPEWPEPKNCIEYVLALTPPRLRAKSLFWAAFHCARIVPKAATPEIAAWTREGAKLFRGLTDNALLRL